MNNKLKIKLINYYVFSLSYHLVFFVICKVYYHNVACVYRYMLLPYAIINTIYVYNEMCFIYRLAKHDYSQEYTHFLNDNFDTLSRLQLKKYLLNLKRYNKFLKESYPEIYKYKKTIVFGLWFPFIYVFLCFLIY